MFVELLATIVMVCTGLLVWLKRKLPAVDSKTAELVQHLKMYDTTDMDRDDKEMKELRKDNYLELVENYYNLTTDLFHIIWGPHYSMGVLFPVENGKWQTYPACQQMYQCYLGLSLQANENMVLGDFGCGTGGPTRCIAQFTGAKIKAVNITKYHLQQMQKWNEEMNIAHRIEPICSDYHHTPIESNSLDGVYMCESLGHSPDYKMLCKEVFRVLKPGARFTGFNWDLTDNFDENNPEHRKIRFMLCSGLAMPQMVTMSVFAEALKEAGFEIITQRDHGDFTQPLGAKPWWYIIEDRSMSYKVVLQRYMYPCIFTSFTTVLFTSIWLLEKLGLVGKGTSEAYRTLMINLKFGIKEGAKHKVFTPMHYWLARKPLK